MKDLEVGDRVVAYLSDPAAVSYYGKARFLATVVSIRAHGLVKVELDDTGSQDSEGYNAIATVHRKALRRLRLRRK